MPKHINHSRLRGNIAEPEVFPTQKDEEIVVRFRLATTKKWKDKNTGEQREMTAWHTCVAFRHTAKYLRDYAPKGSLVEVDGEIAYEPYKDSEGIERIATKIIVSEADILIKGGASNGNSQSPQPNGQSAAENNRSEQPATAGAGEKNPFDLNDDDVPF